MSQRLIITAPDPRLKVKSEPVERVDDEVRKLIDDLLDTMYGEASGVGLAAVQIGAPKRVLVIDIGRADETPNPLKIANPEIIWASEEETSAEEGCLSMPEYFAEVTRSAAVRIRYLDCGNELRELEADGFLATCLQHEIDHLDGILFVDRLSALKRNIILRKLVKQKKTTKEHAEVPVL